MPQSLPLVWALPFAGLLLSIAFIPLVAPKFWHAHYGKIGFAWALVFVLPFGYVFGRAEAMHAVAHALVEDFVPFIVVLLALFTIAGGIGLRGGFGGTPLRNAGVLAAGAALASFMGTTGASMLLIRPLLAANEHRARRAHVVVFFILLVANTGGALSPLGDPPLFIGFLKGVDFFWTTRHLALSTLVITVALIALFIALDTWFFRREHKRAPDTPGFALEGGANLVLLLAVDGAVLMSGLWQPGIQFDVFGATLPLQNLVRDVLLVALAAASLALTPAGLRARNKFHWEPILEVAKLFAAIFVTIAPVIWRLQAGQSGALSFIGTFVRDDQGQLNTVRVFWATGILSSFLDNAPTYLVFFNLAGGDAAHLMGPIATTLLAMSMAAVYFGALTYIGNAPNLMIKAIAEDLGVAMPSFFAYLFYASLVLVPLLVLVSVLFL